MARRGTQQTVGYVSPAARGAVPGHQRSPNGTYGRQAVSRQQPKGLVDYPRAGRRGFRRWIPSWRLVLAIASFFFLTFAVAFVAAYAATGTPTADELVKAQTSIVYYADGKSEIGRMAERNRRNVALDTVPDHAQKAVLAAEDRSFNENTGVSPTSIARAAWSNARGNSLQGGSTITQQYVKNVFDLRDRTLTRKAKEFFIALKITRETSKQEILTGYLNTIYMGRGAYGVEAASHAYFGKGVSKLTVSESAYLAGIINGPELYDPLDGPESTSRAMRRWNYVLDGMAEEGWLSAGDRATQKFPKVIEQSKRNKLAGQRGYLMTMVQAELVQSGLTEEELRTGGYKIVTTFDKGMVADAAKAVKTTVLDVSGRPKGLQIGMATIDPASGAVRSIYGGENYVSRARNAATQDVAQAGSTFKPFGLVAALEDRVNLRSRFNGRSPQYIEGTKVENYGGSNYGYIDLLRATASSVNTVYVHMNEQVGPEKTQEVAIRAGIPKAGAGEKNLVNVLGSASPHVIDMAGAYATFAANGVRRQPYVVQSVRLLDDPDNELGPIRPKEVRVFEKSVMADATYAMQQVVRYGSGSYASSLGRPVAGKTGTSSDNRSAWFVGYTPQLVTAVAMYREGNEQIQGFGGYGSITGGSFPVRIWTEFMGDALDGAKVIDFPEPKFGGEVINPEPVVTPEPEPTPTEEPEPTQSEEQTQEPDPGEEDPDGVVEEGDGQQGQGNGRLAKLRKKAKGRP